MRVRRLLFPRARLRPLRRRLPRWFLRRPMQIFASTSVCRRRHNPFSFVRIGTRRRKMPRRSRRGKSGWPIRFAIAQSNTVTSRGMGKKSGTRIRPSTTPSGRNFWVCPFASTRRWCRRFVVWNLRLKKKACSRNTNRRVIQGSGRKTPIAAQRSPTTSLASPSTSIRR